MANLKKSKTELRSIDELHTRPDYKDTKQFNTKLSASFIKSLEAMAMEKGLNKQDIIQLAVFNYLSMTNYLDKKITVA